MANKYNIAFVIQANQHLRKFASIFRNLNSNYNVCIYTYRDYYPALKADTKFNKLKIYNLDAPRRIFSNLTKAIDKKGRRRSILSIFSFFLPLYNLCKKIYTKYISNIYMCYYISSSKQVSSFRHLLEESKPDIVIFAEANIDYLTEGLIAECKRQNISTLICPYTFCSPSEPARAYFNSSMHRAKWFYKFIFPQKWFYTYRGRRLIRMPFLQAYAISRLGITPPEPWIQESSTADALIAESQKIEQHYVNHKIAKTQIYTIGDPAHDILFKACAQQDELKKKIYKEIHFDHNKPTIVFAIFPDYFRIHKDQYEFFSYDECLRYIIKLLSNLDDFAVILCLHSSMLAEEFAHLESTNVKISSRPTIELLAIADIYIASVSATIKWAIAAGVPVINYDVYKFRYGDYLGVHGVKNVETKKEFVDAVKKFNSKVYLKSLRKQMQPIKRDWGVLDGKFANRLKNLIDELIERRRCEQ